MRWIKSMMQEARIKSSLILDGNVRDEFYTNQTYLSLPIYLQTIFTQPNWLMSIVWDPTGVLNFATKEDAKSYNDLLFLETSEDVEGEAFDMGSDHVTGENLISREKKINFQDLIEEFSIVAAKTIDPINLIINWGDYKFNPTNMLQDQDRLDLITLGKYSLDSNHTNKIRSNTLAKSKSTIIIITSNISHIPYSFYQPDPRVKVITIPKPDLSERREFVLRHFSDFKLAENSQERTREEIADDLSALTDDFTMIDLRMLLELSNQMDKKYEATKLVSLYKFGEKDSPWELLTDDKLKRLKEELNSRVIGQENAINHVVTTIIKASLGISGLQHSAKRTKPKGSLFFSGPTGVGKTELAKGIAKFLFGDESAFIRFDMSEFKQEEADQRLIGAPPGYVGFENGGQLTNAVMEKPFSVIL
ncbi:MAG: AAA family ATPase, partial [Candidatus Heimdallarchaeota archaeon]|nr:AAA family ATPase [Candidatus Heimdallarchaeota archaeon]